MREEAKELLGIIEEICKNNGKAELWLIYAKARKKLNWNTKEIRFWLKYLFDKSYLKWNDNKVELWQMKESV